MQRRPRIAAGLELVAEIVAGFAATEQRRCGPAHDDAPRESAQLEAALRCARGSDDDARRLCFVEAVSALNQWRGGPSRDAAFARAEATLSGWPDRQRAARTSHVIHERERRVLDTIGLVRELTDWYPDDTDRDPAELTRLAIHSPLAREITAFTMVRAPVRFAWFAQGPGLSRLRSLTLLDVGDRAKDFDHLLQWPALTTLERVRLRDERALIRGDSLWDVLRAATALRSLVVDFDGASHAAHRLLVETQLSKRLRALRLGSGYLSSREVDALVANRSLDALMTLDLRGNSLTDADIARLRSAPHFARTEVIVDPPR
jgi:hypothetical protein